MRPNVAIIPAAGYGTRFRPFTYTVPKELLPINGVPTIELAVREALEAGIEHVIIVLSPSKTDIIKHLTLVDLAKYCSFVVQTERPGLGGAILSARRLINQLDIVAILLPDEVHTSSPLNNMYLNSIAVAKVPKRDTSKYGIVELAGKRVTKLIEKPNKGETSSRYAIVGRYVVTPTLFNILSRLEKEAEGELGLTEALQEYIKSIALQAHVVKSGRFDTGTPEGYLNALNNLK